MMIQVDLIKKTLPLAYAASDLPLSGRNFGKVRDWYVLGDGKRLLVTTDRLSAFDRVLAAVPFKGQVLNQMSAWWFERSSSIIANHLISVPDPNAMIVREVRPLPVEVIVRGYITGVTTTSLWYRYSLGEREIYGYHFPAGLQKNQPLPQAIITPTTKGGAAGHDERLTCAEVVSKGYLTAEVWEQIQTAALALFAFGQQAAQRAGLILVDTKYEFGQTVEGQLVLIDEVHTPDSSRFWKLESYEQRLKAGKEPEFYDKEFVRLAYTAQDYRGDGAPPALPETTWIETSRLYISIYEMLTGVEFIPGDYPIESRLVENLRKDGILE